MARTLKWQEDKQAVEQPRGCWLTTDESHESGLVPSRTVAAGGTPLIINGGRTTPVSPFSLHSSTFNYLTIITALHIPTTPLGRSPCLSFATENTHDRYQYLAFHADALLDHFIPVAITHCPCDAAWPAIAGVRGRFGQVANLPAALYNRGGACRVTAGATSFKCTPP